MATKDYERILYVDTSDLNEKLTKLRDAMTEEQFGKAMYGVFKRAGGHVRTILVKDLPKAYVVKSTPIRQAVKGPKMSAAGVGMPTCVIPVRSPRMDIGGDGKLNSFKVTKGGAHGWNAIKYAGKPYSLTVKILNGQTSVIRPKAGKRNGRGYPFRNLSAPSLNNKAYARQRNSRLPIQKIVGIGIPQMPLNRSEDAVETDIIEYLEKRIDARYAALIKNGK